MDKNINALGLMSGTSMDGIDASIIISDGEKNIDIIGNLHSKGVNVSYYDPFVENLDINTPIKRELDVKNFNNYDLILFHTAHSQFSKINFQEIDVPIFDATGTDYLSNSERI